MNDATGNAPLVAVHHAAHAGLIHDTRLSADEAARLFASPGEEQSGRGRGAIRLVESASGRVVIRHYRRGGAIARLSRDWFIWTGAEGTRPFREFRITQALQAQGLSVPEVVAARYVRAGAGYRLAERLAAGQALDWSDLGRVIAQFHRHGLWHADLNAHNVLYDGNGRALLIDFDRARLLEPGASRLRGNLDRLARSLSKLGHAAVVEGAGWRELVDHYAKTTRAVECSR
jgi:3-deoxy-D-manno-octulosonic acid kinase